MNNLHVAIVHFPIALLTLYSLLEIVRIRAVQNFLHHFHVKAFLVIFGTATAVASGLTGAAVEDQFRGDTALQPVIHMHSSVAEITTAFYGIFALLYLIVWMSRENKLDRLRLGFLKKYVPRIEAWLMSPWMILWGFAGLILITLTGALGGIIAFGPQVDPISQVVYNLFFIK